MKFDRSRLPSPIEYYSRQFSTLIGYLEWERVLCPFHDDHRPSLAINLKKGHFICHACNEKGGDILAFEMKLRNIHFREALTRLENDFC